MSVLITADIHQTDRAVDESTLKEGFGLPTALRPEWYFLVLYLLDGLKAEKSGESYGLYNNL
jgi:hypothetical protein